MHKRTVGGYTSRRAISPRDNYTECGPEKRVNDRFDKRAKEVRYQRTSTGFFDWVLPLSYVAHFVVVLLLCIASIIFNQFIYRGGGCYNYWGFQMECTVLQNTCSSTDVMCFQNCSTMANLFLSSGIIACAAAVLVAATCVFAALTMFTYLHLKFTTIVMSIISIVFMLIPFVLMLVAGFKGFCDLPSIRESARNGYGLGPATFSYGFGFNLTAILFGIISTAIFAIWATPKL